MYNPYHSIKANLKFVDLFDTLMNKVVDACNLNGSFTLYKDGVKLFSWNVVTHLGGPIVVDLAEAILTPSPEKQPEPTILPKVSAKLADEDYSWDSSNPFSGWEFEDVGAD